MDEQKTPDPQPPTQPSAQPPTPAVDPARLQPVTPPATPPVKTPAKPPDAGHMPMGEEMDSAGRTLPPVVPVLAALLVVAIILAITTVVMRRPVAKGSVDRVVAVSLPGDASVLVAVTLTVANATDKPLWIKHSKVHVKAGGKEYDDEDASVADFERYYQAFPDLRQQGVAPLAPESKIPPGSQQQGIVIVGFPVTKAVFDLRQSLTATIEPYDQPSVGITETR